ncbi:MAG TPA: DNA polymerase domain-containing protein [Nitrososphaeraceae archaeon]
MISGCLFDAYPLSDKMVFWIKQNNGKTTRIIDDWTHSIYVASDSKSILKSIINKEEISSFVKDYEIRTKYEKMTDTIESEVLQLTLTESTKAAQLASRIERIARFGEVRLYNVDVLPAQSYFYDHNIFPLANCKVNLNTSKSSLQWDIQDDIWSTDYELPTFVAVRLTIYPKINEGRIPKFSDRIDSIKIQKYKEKDSIEIKSQSESDILYQLMKEIAAINPDFILTYDGDSFTFPYIVERSEENGVELVLDRERIPLSRPKKEGISYFSYGRIYFKPTSTKLLGRIHIDTDNSFVLNEAGLEGLYELARICKMPLHEASRASIGKCMSSLQFYYASKKGLLIPWKPIMIEHPKTMEELLLADRGGIIFEPEIGVHEKVSEYDFVSLYPNIMYRKNISAETVLCNCCPESKLSVPGLKRYYRCEKRTGIVPISLKILLNKRIVYKKLENSTSDPKLKYIYDLRRTALKWVLVTSFGYLGFNNAKFGRIDAHIAVCAFDRHILMQSMKIAEKHNFYLLHGIVDSIWVRKKNASQIDYSKLKKSIEHKTGFDISFEGIYNWIVFVPSKDSTSILQPLPVANRYFGIFENGILKIRGIEARRHDTPIFFSEVQQMILNIMAEGKTVLEVVDLMPKVKEIFDTNIEMIRKNKISLDELVFTRRISKDFGDYDERSTVENHALTQLSKEGKALKAGQILKYVVTNYYYKNAAKRSIPIELTTSKTKYDVRRYTELFIETCSSIIEPFGMKLSCETRKL